MHRHTHKVPFTPAHYSKQFRSIFSSFFCVGSLHSFLLQQNLSKLFLSLPLWASYRRLLHLDDRLLQSNNSISPWDHWVSQSSLGLLLRKSPTRVCGWGQRGGQGRSSRAFTGVFFAFFPCILFSISYAKEQERQLLILKIQIFVGKNKNFWRKAELTKTVRLNQSIKRGRALARV